MGSRSYWLKKIEDLRRKEREEGFDLDLRGIRDEEKRWESKVLRSWLSRTPEREKRFGTPSGITSKRLYTPADMKSFDYRDQISFPGVFPFTRGIYPTMYRGRLWTMRMFSGFGAPEDTNKRLRHLLEEGETGLSIAFDMPTLYGYDSDHPRARGEVGICGVSVSSLADMETIFKGIPLEKVSTSMTINAPAAAVTCMYIATAEKQGVPKEKLRGTVQADMFKEYIAQKEWVYPPRAHLRIVRDMMVYCTKKMPLWNYISISGYHIREAGATAVQELAFTLADGFAYVDLGLQADLDVDEFAPRLSFFFNCGMNFFEEVAKFRAARRIWATVMREKYGAKDQRSLILRFHTQTSGASLTWQQPLNNIVRTTIEALAAVLGGTQSLHTNAYDEAWALPTEEAATIALRTQQIIAGESGVADVIDPLGGSYYLEWLTNEMEERTYRYLRKIEALGGVLEAIEKGYVQKEIADSAYRESMEVENGERVIVGANRYLKEGEKPIHYLRIPHEVEKRQVESLGVLKRRRDAPSAKNSLKKLEEVFRESDANCMESILEAVKSYATLGEIVDAGRKVFGEWREPGIL